MKKKGLLAALSLLVAATILTGCGGKATDTSGDKKGGTVRYAIWSSPKGVFNTTLSNDIYDNRVNSLIYSTLISLDENNKFIPGLAESYEVSSDNLTITFKLNKNAKWHDGEKVTAKDVEFTFTSMASPDYKGPRFGEIEKVKGAKDYKEKKADKVEGINVVDDNTITFTYSEIYAPALANFAVRGILPKHIWEKAPIAEWDKQTDLLKKPIGSGPFKLNEFVQDQYVELVRNDDYYLGAPNLEKFILKVSNKDTAQNELINGDLDIAVLSSFNQKDIDAYTGGGAKLLEYDGSSYQFLTMNNDNELFKDKRVRQALIYGINRKGIVDNLLNGHGAEINAPLVLGSFAYPKEGLNSYEYNVEKAKSLLKEAGFVEKNDLLEKDGKPFKTTLLVPTGNVVREKSAPIIQQNLKDLGITVDIQTMDFASLKAKVVDKREYEMALMGFTLELDPADAKTYWSKDLANKPGFNVSNFKNDNSEELLNKGAATLKEEDRKTTYNEWAKLLNDEVPFVFLYSPKEARVYNPKLKEYNFSTYAEFPNVQNWYLEK